MSANRLRFTRYVRSMHLIAIINACDRLGVEGVPVVRADSEFATVALTREQEAAIVACGYPVTDDWRTADAAEGRE